MVNHISIQLGIKLPLALLTVISTLSILLLVINISSAQQECIEPYGGMVINQSGYYKFCPGEYYLTNCTMQWVGDRWVCAPVLIAADNVTLDCNYAILNGSLNKTMPNSGITGYARFNVTVKNCILVDFTTHYFGISRNITFENNIIYHTRLPVTDALHLGTPDSTPACVNCIVRNNSISGGAIGIVLGRNAHHNLVEGNRVDSGILVTLRKQVTIFGIAIMEGGDYNVVIHNNATNLYLEDTSYNYIAHNHFQNELGKRPVVEILQGGQKEGCHNNIFYNNTFAGVMNFDEAVYTGGFNTNNSFIGNRFIQNRKHVTSSPQNNFSGNFWDDPCILNMTDSDLDGYYDSGPGYPYSGESGCKISGVTDYHPCVFPSCQPDLEPPQIDFISPSYGSRVDQPKIELELLIRDDQKLREALLGLMDHGGNTGTWKLDLTNCSVATAEGSQKLKLSSCELEYRYGLMNFPILARLKLSLELSPGWNSISITAYDSLNRSSLSLLRVEYLPSCSSQGGIICYGYCRGELIPASDTDRCCLGYCYRPRIEKPQIQKPQISIPPSCNPSNLSIYPERAFPGELISIQAQISNPGDLSIKCELHLRLNGELMNTSSMELDPRTSKFIQFSFIPEQPGIYNLSLDGLSGRLEVIEIPSATPTPVPIPLPTPLPTPITPSPSPSPMITPSPIPSPTPTPLGFELLLGSIAILLGALIRSRR